MKIQNTKRHFLFSFVIYSQRKCKPSADASLAVVGPCSNKDNKDFDSSLWQKGRKREKTEYSRARFFFSLEKEC